MPTTLVDDIASGVMLAAPFSADDALARAEICTTHEAERLEEIVASMRALEMPFAASMSVNTFVTHRCARGVCHLIGAPFGESVYVCPVPDTHPPHKRNADGSVLHRWSHDMFMCYDYGTPHLCTMSMCSHQQLADTEIVCTLTGRVLGAPIASVSEIGDGFAFDSGKAMTVVHTSFADTAAIEERVSSYRRKRPEMLKMEEQAAAADNDARVVEAQGLVRAIDMSAFAAVPDSALTAGHIEAPPPRKLLVTTAEAINKNTVNVSKPMTSTAPPPLHGNHFSFAITGAHPTKDVICADFASLVAVLFNQLEDAYSLQKRNEELRLAEQQVIAKFTDKRRSKSRSALRAPTQVPHEAVVTMHRDITQHALEGMEWVLLMSGYAPWRDGHVRADESRRLIDRMWKLWETITRSPLFREHPEPYLFRNIRGALLTLVIEGYSMPACFVSHADGSDYVHRQCSHREDATSLAPCEHRKLKLHLVSPSRIMAALLEPAGMVHRALDPARGHILGRSNTIVSFLTSLFKDGVRTTQLKLICVSE